MNDLQQLILDLWKPNSTRSRYSAFRPVFIHFNGVGDEDAYNSVCRSIQEQSQNRQDTCLLPAGIPFQPQIEVLQQLKAELPRISLEPIQAKDLTMFSNPTVNELYLNALNYTFHTAKALGQLPTRKSQENFVCNQIVYSTQYLLPLIFEDDHAPKLIVYDQGNLDEKAFWFLLLCHVMGMDVIVLNPNGYQETWWSFDKDHLSTAQNLHPISRKSETFEQRVKQGRAPEKIRTTVATLSDQINTNLFGSTGVFKPWMFRRASVHRLLIDGTRIDLEDLWNREARLREGFQSSSGAITIPSFFVEIDGVDRNVQDYLQLLRLCATSPNTLFDSKGGRALFGELPSQSEAVRLVFTMNPDGTFHKEKLIASGGALFDHLSAETANRVVDTLNEWLKRKPHLSKDERVKLASLLLSLSVPLARLIENFDYPFAVPKITLFLEKDSRLDPNARLILPFLSELGLDIAIFSPAGVSGLNAPNRSILRLEQMAYDFQTPDFSNRNQSELENPFKKIMSMFKS